MAGYQVQDSPVYGAERRGAPVMSFTRIDEQPILERGMIADPDLILVADETLLEDPGAGVLSGQNAASAVFVNTASAEGLAEHFAIKPRLLTLDITARSLEALGRASALSAGMGAAAARLCGRVTEPQLAAALEEELSHLELAAEEIERNMGLAKAVFEDLPTVTYTRREAAALATMHALAYDHPRLGTPSVLAAGNSELRHTGSWRIERPEIDLTRCTRCGLCFVRCPDGAIALDDEGYPQIDYDHCKGCMICHQVCPVKGGIIAERETEAW